MKKVKRNSGMFKKGDPRTVKMGTKGAMARFKKIGREGMVDMINKRWQKTENVKVIHIQPVANSTGGDTIKE